MEDAYRRRARWVIAGLWTGCCLAGFPFAGVAGDWTIAPFIAGQESFTDNVLLTPTNRRSDFVTGLFPGVSINGESARFRATLNYSPIVELFALTPNQNFVGQNLYANGNAILVPDLFFLDARGYMSLLPTNPGLTTAGGFAAPVAAPGAPSAITGIPSVAGTSLLNPLQGLAANQLSQVSSFSASPYLSRRFDGFGTGELRYTLSDSNTSGLQTGGVTPTGFAAQNTSVLTNEVTASFLTGENFGRYQGHLVLDANRSSGTGVFSGSRQTTEVLDSSYAITYSIKALASIGHEDINYGGNPPTRIDDIVWGVGAQFTPSPDLNLTVNYGHRNGVTSPTATLNYNVTGRTSLSVSYSESIYTTAQNITNNLAISSVNSLGQLIDARTGLPIVLTNPVLGLQAGVFDTKYLTATATTTWDRDQLSALLYHFDSSVAGQTTPGSGISQTTTGANLTWSHDLNPLTTAYLGVGYAHSNLGPPSGTTEDLVNAGVSMTYLLSSTLTGWASYSFLDRTSPQPQFRLTSNVITVGLRKSF
ncbi:MAG: outer membrane beta-barrel protein [Acidobacteria bacterium]|nr:outer membrane beta-barrel protein [Acidobacteriota bacterium]